jgi:hypothetical protein
MGKMKENMSRRMQTIRNCFSVATKQGGEGEQDAATGLQKVATRTRFRLGALLDCLYDARKSANKGKTDLPTRKSYRKLPH